ncbi:MAG: extracellular solute-binding protein [Deinococcus sp.]|nr:extracellular solute-binding protein [Deinococcus sp.]
MRKTTLRILVLMSGIALLLGLVHAQTGASTVVVISSGNVNVLNLWQDHLVPAFEAAFPDIDVVYENADGTQAQEAIFARMQASIEAGVVADIDIFETSQGNFTRGAAFGLWTTLTEAEIPNLARVVPSLLTRTDGLGVPYRGSAVLLAYDSRVVDTPPRTIREIVDWARANPGQFTYCNPTSGCGSGNAFMFGAISLFVPTSELLGNEVDQALVDLAGPAFDLLAELNPFVYRGGVYAASNGEITNFFEQGLIQMAPQWSDQLITALDTGRIPPEIKFTQIDPPFFGFDSFLGVASNSPNQSTAHTFINWLLTDEAQRMVIEQIKGFPSVQASLLPEDLRGRFEGISERASDVPSSVYQSRFREVWQERVPSAAQ